jgi:hypothetical protein
MGEKPIFYGNDVTVLLKALIYQQKSQRFN